MNKGTWEWFENYLPEISVAVTDQGDHDPEKRDLIFVDLSKTSEKRHRFTLDHEYGTMIYDMNTNGFRGDDFTDKHNKKHIIFLGCSETYGLGGNIEDAWSHMLYSKISEKFDLDGFYNLGMNGIGWIDILSLVQQYITSFGNPDAIFIMFPNMERYISWVTKQEAEKMNLYRGYYKMGHFNKEDIKKLNLKNKKHFIRTKNKTESMDDFAKMALSIQLLEMYCNKQGIKIFWSSTMIQLRNIISSNFISMFKGFVDIDDRPEVLYDMIKSNPSLTIRKADVVHAGTAHHQIWANSLFEKFMESENM